jgi:DNA-binding NarL/FixJ family response regulator
VDPEIFFPVAEEGPALRRAVRAAKSVCARCTVRSECLSFAEVALSDGIAGGLTPEQRRQRRQVRAKAARRRTPSRSKYAVSEGLGLLASGWTVDEVAREFGVSERTVQRWSAQARRGAA